MSTDFSFRALCAELVSELEAWQTADAEFSSGGTVRGDADYELAPRARTALAQPEPEALTVQECNDMRKHRENYIYEYCDGDIELDGCFSREDLLELARTIPANPRPPES
jgi:hypothetical protein